MTLTGTKVTEINKTYKEELEKSHVSNGMGLNVGFDNQYSDKVYAGNWMVCNIEDISKMIKELETLKAVIEYETGIVM